MLRYLGMLKPYKWWVILALLAGIFTVGANMGLMSTSAYLIAKAAQHPYTILLLWVPIVGVRFFGTSRGVFRYFERYISHDVTFQLLKELRVFVYRRLEPLIPAGWGVYHSGDLLSRVVGDIDVLQNLYLGLFSPPIIAATTFAAATAFMGMFAPSLAECLAVFLLLSGFAVPFLTQWTAKKTGRSLIRARGALSTQLVEVIHGNTDILAMNQEERYLGSLSQQIRQWARQRVYLHQISGASAALTLLLNNGAMWVVLVVGIELIDSHRLASILLPVVVLLSLASFEAVNQLPGAFQFQGQVREAARRINELVDKNPLVSQGGVDAQSVIARGNPPHVSLHEVHFAYDHEESERLRGITFSVQGGQHVALVGPSGAGKTTLTGILSGLWPYSQGEVLVNGVPLDTILTRELPRLVAVVEQEPHLFNTTLRQNLLLANPDATQTQIDQALDIAQLRQVVTSLPNGLDTVIGEQGAQLSGGERKRVAIARVILQNTPLIIMDEATEGLDAVTERKAIHAITEWARDRTVVWITHRLSNLDIFDAVIVLNQGTVAEVGSAQDLAAGSGVFARMLTAEGGMHWGEGWHQSGRRLESQTKSPPQAGTGKGLDNSVSSG